MLIISSTIISLSVNNLKTKNLSNMYTDIKSLEDKIAIYYNKYGTLPLKEKYNGKYDFNIVANPNDDTDGYYIIDVKKLNNLILTKKLTWEAEDVYIINTQTHTIYYPKGIELDGEIYYRLPGEYSKIEIEKIPDLTEENINFSYSTKEWTNQSVVVTATTKISGYTLQTSQNGTNWDNKTTQIYNQNGKIYARLTDGKSYGNTIIADISNIDILAPNNFSVDIINTTTKSILVKVATTDQEENEISGKSGDIKYRFSKDNGQSWTEYQESGNYEFDKLYGDLGGTTYNIKVQATDKAGNNTNSEIQASTIINSEYYCNTKGELLGTIGGRNFWKSEDDAVAYYTSYDYTHQPH